MQLVKLLELREANHIEFRRIKNVAEEILQMHDNPELCKILKLLMDPTSVATGLNLELDTLVSAKHLCSLEVTRVTFIDSFYVFTSIGADIRALIYPIEFDSHPLS